MLLTCAGNKHTLDGHFTSQVAKISELKARGTVLLGGQNGPGHLQAKPTSYRQRALYNDIDKYSNFKAKIFQFFFPK